MTTASSEFANIPKITCLLTSKKVVENIKSFVSRSNQFFVRQFQDELRSHVS